MWVEAISPRELRGFDLISSFPRCVLGGPGEGEEGEWIGERTLEEEGLHPQATFFLQENESEDEGGVGGAMDDAG